MSDPHTTERGADPAAVIHSEGSMGSKPTQAMFLSGWAMALIALIAIAMIVAFVAMGNNGA
ncbi:MAG: hypothetical protein JWR75_662 [Devosia sp.]|nr:hypothetical protein [Devosia sp.]